MKGHNNKSKPTPAPAAKSAKPTAAPQTKKPVAVPAPPVAADKKRKVSQASAAPAKPVVSKKPREEKVPTPVPSEDSEEEEDEDVSDEEEFDEGSGSDDDSDDDGDSVDSDTSGTISEDLDLNKPNDSDEDEDSDSDDEDDEEDGDKTITVDFEFKDPQPIDFLSLRNLLSRYLPTTESSKTDDKPTEATEKKEAEKDGEGEWAESDSDGDSSDDEKADRAEGKSKGKRAKKTATTLVAAFNPSEIADAVINQVEVGTTVKAGDDPDVYAFVTALGFNEHKDVSAFRVISDYLVKKCPKKKRAQLRAILQNKKTALLLNERMINMPVEIAPNLHKCFVDDLDWAKKQPGLDAKFDFKQLIVMSSRFQAVNTAKKKPVEHKIEVRAPVKAKAGKGDSDSSSDDDDGDDTVETGGDIVVAEPDAKEAAAVDNTLHFYKWEEALLQEACTFEFTFGVGSTAQIEGAAPQFRTVMAIGLGKYRDAVGKMHERLAEAMAAEAAEKAAAGTK